MTDHPFEPITPDDLADWITDIAEDPHDTAHDTDLADGPGPWGDDLADQVDSTLYDGGDGVGDGDAGLDLNLGLDLDGAGDDGDGDGTGLGDDDRPWISLDDPDGDADATNADHDESGYAAPGDGAARLDTLVHTAEALGGGADPAALDALLDRVEADEAVYGVEGRTAVQVFEAMGVDAHVAHGSVEDLADRLDAGERIVVTGEDGRRHAVVEVDFAGGLLVLDADGEHHAVGLAAFVERWSGAAFEMVVAGGADVEVLLPVPVTLGGI